MKLKKSLLLYLSVLLLFVQCSKDIDTYYDRPDWLEDPIYQELEKAGNFTEYLKAIDRTPYSNILKGASLYTCFAPNDSAFSNWLADNGYASIEDVPAQTLRDIVSYSLVYNKFIGKNLGAALVDRVWAPNKAYKYKTPYYKMLWKDKRANGNSVWVVNVNKYADYDYSSKTNLIINYKYLPVYTPGFFNASIPAVTPEDYKAFYPNADFSLSSLANVGAANVVGVENYAENGIYYEVNKVQTPIPSMYDIMTSDSLYSSFFNLLDYKSSGGAFYYKNFLQLPSDMAETVKKIYPDSSIDNVYLRAYIGALDFDPSVERYEGDGSSSDVSQENAYTLFVPTSDAISRFFKNKLGKYYNTWEDVPIYVMTAFLNAQSASSLIWPSWIKNRKMNIDDEYIVGSADGDSTGITDNIKQSRMASNGIMYLVDNYVKSSYFESVYSELFLNPDYKLLGDAFSLYYSTSSSLIDLLRRSPLSGYNNERNTVFLAKDKYFRNDGFYYDAVNEQFLNTNLTASGSSSRLKRLMKNSLFFGYHVEDSIEMPGASMSYPSVTVSAEGTWLDSSYLFSEGLNAYDKWQYRVTYEGEMIRFKNGIVQGIGNIEDGTEVHLTRLHGGYNNGEVYDMDGLIEYSPRNTGPTSDSCFIDRPLWYYLNKAREENPDVKEFVDLVDAIMRTDKASTDLLGVKSSNFYTVLMPNNSAMDKARAAGLYPEKIDVESDPTGVDNALRFLQGHFLVGQVVADDNLPIIFPYQNLADDPTMVVLPTLLAINNDELGLVNEKAKVVAYKASNRSGSTFYLKFYANNMTVGNTIVVEGTPSLNDGVTNHLSVRRRSTGTTGEFKHSNRMACKAVLHEVDKYINFVDK